MAPAFFLITHMIKKLKAFTPDYYLDLSNQDYLIKKVGKYGVYFRNINPKITKDTPIFRYIKLDHLISQLDGSYLFVNRRVSFSDLREKSRINKISSSLRSSELFKVVESYRDKTNEKEIESIIKSTFQLCASCWTLDSITNRNVTENFLMWKAYRNSDLMCRIGTTIEKLIHAINPTCDVIISDICYGDRSCRAADRFTFNKTPYYEWESEVRLVPLRLSSEPIKISIHSMENFIDTITLSPFISPFIECELLCALKKRYPSLKDKIQPSKILEY